MYKNLIILANLIMFALGAWAQTKVQEIVLGQTAKIKITIPEPPNSVRCNIDIFPEGDGSFQMTIEPPNLDAIFEFTPKKIGVQVFRWEGKFKRAGLNSVGGCPGAGIVQLNVIPNAEITVQKWNSLFSRLGSNQVQCLKTGMDLNGIKYQSINPTEQLTPPDDPKLKSIYDSCDRFFQTKTAWSGKRQEEFPCTTNGIQTTCEGVYAERTPDGKLRAISLENALQNHFENKPWTTGQRERPDIRASRLKMEEDAKAIRAKQEADERERIAAEQQAKAAAEERERKYKDSPEYKKRQEEALKQQKQRDLERQEQIARQRAEQEEQNARAKKEQEEQALRIKKEQEEAERKKRLNVKSATDI